MLYVHRARDCRTCGFHLLRGTKTFQVMPAPASAAWLRMQYSSTPYQCWCSAWSTIELDVPLFQHVLFGSRNHATCNFFPQSTDMQGKKLENLIAQFTTASVIINEMFDFKNFVLLSRFFRQVYWYRDVLVKVTFMKCGPFVLVTKYFQCASIWARFQAQPISSGSEVVVAAAQAVEALAFRFLVILEAVFFWIYLDRDRSPSGVLGLCIFFRSFPLQLYFDETLVTRTEWWLWSHQIGTTSPLEMLSLIPVLFQKDTCFS